MEAAPHLQLLPGLYEFCGEPYGMSEGGGLPRHGDEKVYGSGKFNPSDLPWQPSGKGLALVAENVPPCSNEEGGGQLPEQGVRSKSRADAVVADIGTTHEVRGVESLHDVGVQSVAVAVGIPR